MATTDDARTKALELFDSYRFRLPEDAFKFIRAALATPASASTDAATKCQHSYLQDHEPSCENVLYHATTAAAQEMEALQSIDRAICAALAYPPRDMEEAQDALHVIKARVDAAIDAVVARTRKGQ